MVAWVSSCSQEDLFRKAASVLGVFAAFIILSGRSSTGSFLHASLNCTDDLLHQTALRLYLMGPARKRFSNPGRSHAVRRERARKPNKSLDRHQQPDTLRLHSNKIRWQRGLSVSIGLHPQECLLQSDGAKLHKTGPFYVRRRAPRSHRPMLHHLL